MAKIGSRVVTQHDLLDFLGDRSDFAFETEVLKSLVDKGFMCEHGGTYDDPATKKPRQYDIRATKGFGTCFLRFAVECKNLQANYPLLVSCLPRRDEEAFHEVIFSVNPQTHPLDVPESPYTPALLRRSKSLRLRKGESLYPSGAPVGKCTDQVGRASQSNEIVSGDSGVYDKWAQALSSADDLTCLACSDGEDRAEDGVALSLVFPIVAVPNDRLWRVEYDEDGQRTSDPEQVARCSYFVDRNYYYPSPSGGDDYTISHLEFVTSDGLLGFVDSICGDDERARQTFSVDRIEELLGEEQD